MSPSYKLHRYLSVSPYLIVDGAERAVRKDDQDGRGGIRDEGGTTWWISSVVG